MRKTSGAGLSHCGLFIASEISVPAAVFQILERFVTAADKKKLKIAEMVPNRPSIQRHLMHFEDAGLTLLFK